MRGVSGNVCSWPTPSAYFVASGRAAEPMAPGVNYSYVMGDTVYHQTEAIWPASAGLPAGTYSVVYLVQDGGDLYLLNAKSGYKIGLVAVAHWPR